MTHIVRPLLPRFVLCCFYVDPFEQAQLNTFLVLSQAAILLGDQGTSNVLGTFRCNKDNYAKHAEYETKEGLTDIKRIPATLSGVLHILRVRGESAAVF